jgi:periplasmic copper chaperone A
MRGLKLIAVSLLAFAGLTGAAAAHITLETDHAAPNAAYKAVLRVGHGCEGADTTTVRVQIPEGLIVAKPMPKSGWKVELKEGDYAKSYDYYGTPLTKGVKEISWTGGSLPDGFYDEFVFRVRVTDLKPGATVYLPVVQECGQTVERWIEIPAPGKTDEDYEHPAPGFSVTEPQALTH